MGRNGFAKVPGQIVVVAHARAGKSDELPADHIRVAAVNGIAEHALDRVFAQQSKKVRAFDLLQLFVLLFGRKFVEALQSFQAFPIRFARRGLALIAKFARRVLIERALRVTVAVAPVRAGKLAVDVDHHAGFLGARTGIVGRENARCRGRDDQRFFFGEKAQRNFQGLGSFFLRKQARGAAVQRIHQHAADTCRGKNEKLSAPHRRNFTTRKAARERPSASILKRCFTPSTWRGSIPVRPRVALFFVFFPGERLDANPRRTLIANRAFRWLAAGIANVLGVFRPDRGWFHCFHLSLPPLPNSAGVQSTDPAILQIQYIAKRYNRELPGMVS